MPASWRDQIHKSNRLTIIPVSYTHLDVYKRQDHYNVGSTNRYELSIHSTTQLPANNHLHLTSSQRSQLYSPSSVINNFYLRIHCLIKGSVLPVIKF